MALGLKLKNSSRRVYTLIGDGESNEGTVWEAIMVAVNLKLDNLTILYDYNRSQIRSLPMERPADKFLAFDCDVREVNGHDVDTLDAAIIDQNSQVKVIVADTIKGYGCRTLQDDMFEWHRKSPDDKQLEQLLRELDEASI